VTGVAVHRGIAAAVLERCTPLDRPGDTTAPAEQQLIQARGPPAVRVQRMAKPDHQKRPG